MFHYIRDADILAQHSAAGDDHGSYPFAVQSRGMKSAIGGVVVVAEKNHHLGWHGGFVHHPKLTGGPQQRVPGKKENGEKSHEKQQEQQPEKDSAVFAALHEMESNFRSRSAASSGMVALKYTSLML
jgi:hypothetical protein